ncbi:DUF2335 domain-containing protein [Candidatus Poriferisocius sp.]|uniref:DUF2335 domain-containing protein n=1 Tax=Candidatus Poriferisocius sp. TaxID=3101276 RepID=UPI003B5CBA97
MVISQSLEVTSRQGPIPSPEDLRQYEQVLPGLADRIVKWPNHRSATSNGSRRRTLSSARGVRLPVY